MLSDSRTCGSDQNLLCAKLLSWVRGFKETELNPSGLRVFVVQRDEMGVKFRPTIPITTFPETFMNLRRHLGCFLAVYFFSGKIYVQNMA